MKINTPIGELSVRYDDDFVYAVHFENDNPSTDEYKQNKLSEEIKKQFDEYFNGKRKIFELPYKLNTSGFTTESLMHITKMPFGTTTTYKKVAVALGSVQAARAVGNAMNRNPLPIIIPCHRVIGSSGKLVGYRGGLKVKQWLLDFEKDLNIDHADL
jgi:methylated-DNA-[protein]-cysteine S-methyltransferase